MIKIADRSPAGWATIAEYEDDPFANDSEDSKKIRQVKNRSLAKNKNKSSFTSSSKPDLTRRPQFRNDGLQHGFNPPPPPFPSFFPPLNPENPPLTQSQEKFPNQQILATVAGKQGTGTVDALNEPKQKLMQKVILILITFALKMISW